MKRLDLNHGGFKDGTTFRVPTAQRKGATDVAGFLAQAEIAAMRTARVVTRDADGFVKVRDADGEVPMGLVVQGFIDRLGTGVSENAICTGDGEGMSVAVGRFGTTLPLTEEYFDGELTDIKPGTVLIATNGKDGKIGFGDNESDDKIGYVALVDADSIMVEIQL